MTYTLKRDQRKAETGGALNFEEGTSTSNFPGFFFLMAFSRK